MNHQEEMRKAFIADIAANPEDLARRLIFADWLEENGEPDWAKFIQGQIEFAHDDARSQALLTPHLFDKLTPSVGGGATGYTIRRGFVEGISAPLPVLMKYLPAVVQEHPILFVRVTDREPRNHGGYYVSWSESLGIPADVFRLMEDDNGDIGADTDRLEYDTGCSAHAALSVALLKVARLKSCRKAEPAI